jgi:hypothetical protein
LHLQRLRNCRGVGGGGCDDEDDDKEFGETETLQNAIPLL